MLNGLPEKHYSLSLALVLTVIVGLIWVSLAPAGAQPVEVSIPEIQRTSDPAGDSPLLGETVTIDGVVTAVDPQDGGLDGYFVEESEGGPWSGIYVSDASGNRPAIGDLVQITGRVDEFAGLTVITDLEEFTVVSNENPVPAAQGISAEVLTSNGEPWESVRAAIHAATVIDENAEAADEFDEWLIEDATGATARVGHLLGEYDYTPVPGDELMMVRGVGYFSSSGFSIQPVGSADILEQVKYTSIYDIQTVPVEADDASPLDGERVTTAGVVTSVFFPPDGGVRYTLEDVGGGQWSGVWAVDDTENALSRGMHVELTGTVQEYFGRTELHELDTDSIYVHSINNVLPAAAEITTRDINTDQPDAESYEGVLVRTGQVTVVNANPDDPDDFGEWLISDWTGYAVRVNDLGEYDYEPVEADELAFVQGVLDFSFNQFKIQPRDDDDIGTSAVTIGQARQRPLGEEVSLQGAVTVPSGVLNAGFAIQDGTGGIYVFHEDGFTESVGLRDVVDVKGTLTEVNGRLQIVPTNPNTAVVITGMAPVPPPLPQQTGAIGEDTEGWLVGIGGTVVGKSNMRLVVDDGSGSVDVVVSSSTGIDLSGVAIDQEVRIIGLSSQFDEEEPFDAGYRVMPRFQSDVNPSGPGVTTPTPSVTSTVTATPTESTQAVIAVEPAATTVDVGDVVTTALRIRDVAGFYGIDFQMKFDPALVQVVDADEERPGIQVMLGSLFASRGHFVVVNRSDNEAGVIDFTAALLNPEEPVDGSGELVVVTWRGVASGMASLVLQDVTVSDQEGQALGVASEEGSITVRAPTPTATSTPETVPTPTCDGGLCGGTLVVRASYDFRCDGSFSAGVDHGIGGARVTLRYENGAEVATETTNRGSGYAYFNGINLPDGTMATLSIEWPETTDGTLATCPNSRESVDLTARNFTFGTRAVHFRARKVR